MKRGNATPRYCANVKSEVSSTEKEVVEREETRTKETKIREGRRGKEGEETGAGGREGRERERKESQACSILSLLFYVDVRACNDYARLHARNRNGETEKERREL